MTTTEAAPFSIDSRVLSTPTAPPAASPAGLRGWLGRARIRALPGPVVVAGAALLTAVGVAIDLPGDPSLGTGTGVTVVLTALVATGAVRFRALATAAVLPPLLVTAAAVALGILGGRNEGSRELVLDAGTTLALSAPLVFGATAAGLLVVILRVASHMSRNGR